MQPYFTEHFGNPSSRSHPFGRAAEEGLEGGRERVARCLGADPKEIIFTSGATESNNLALVGIARARKAAGDGNHIVGTVIEHKSGIEPLERLAEAEGFRVTFLEVDNTGLVDPDDLSAVLTDDTILVNVMLANNEIGTIQPVAELAERAHSVGAWFHTDAVQGVGKLSVNVEELGVDTLALTAHKFYGPKGAGALYIRRRPRRVKFEPMILGGGQEHGLRSGTHNVPAIVGLGAAIEIAESEREIETQRLKTLRDKLETGLTKEVEGLIVNGNPDHRLTNNLNISVPFIDGEALLLALDDIAVSSGSACRSNAPGVSHVMKAIGRGDDLGKNCIRFGLGRWTTEEEIDYAIRRVSETVTQLRAMSAL